MESQLDAQMQLQKPVGYSSANDELKHGWMAQNRVKQENLSSFNLDRLGSLQKSSLLSGGKFARWPILTRPEQKMIVDIGERPPVSARTSEAAASVADDETLTPEPNSLQSPASISSSNLFGSEQRSRSNSISVVSPSPALVEPSSTFWNKK